MDKAIVVLSGGMDSTTAAYLAQKQLGAEVIGLSFDYGQRHRKELDYARATCDVLGAQHQLISMPRFRGSALTDNSIDVPEGHYVEESMAQTVVPNRNMIMLSIATGLAVETGARWVITGVHAGDHAVYPDCRPEFINAVHEAAYYATKGFAHKDFTIWAPFVDMDKAAIAVIGDNFGVDWTHTWSCYKGEDVHCGKCGTCVERKEAFRIAEVIDVTEYADEVFGVEAYRG
jgi:7-cyano-7-deazaguanine synthase